MNASRSNCLKLEAPIIIIGNGRSGSTLLNQMFGSHPDIVMLGEMNFALAKAWTALWEADANNKLRNIADEYRTDPELEARVLYDPEEQKKLTARLERNEYQRTGEILRRAVAEWFCLSQNRARHWGFKEIFNGAAFRYEWEIYDRLFPGALWVHMVRHPLHSACSVISHDGHELTPSILSMVLKNWLDVFHMARRRSDTGRYWEIKYEFLVADPVSALTPVLDHLRISWDDSCLQAMSRQWGARSRIRRLPAELRAVAERVSGLEGTMSELGYWIQEEDQDFAPSMPRLQAGANGRWQLLGPYWREEGKCWVFPLADVDLAKSLCRCSDDVGEWRRSRLRLFENDQMLGPAHSMHFRIRDDGGGAYSHWQSQLMFSTSDNSDPNQNGRTYTIECGCYEPVLADRYEHHRPSAKERHAIRGNNVLMHGRAKGPLVEAEGAASRNWGRRLTSRIFTRARYLFDGTRS